MLLGLERFLGWFFGTGEAMGCALFLQAVWSGYFGGIG